MKLKFDANQEFQLRAIQSAVDLFEGQQINTTDFEYSSSPKSEQLDFIGIGNRLIINDEQILENLQKVQRRNEIEESKTLDGLNFSFEMETGTGKTYVYLRTIYELNKNYGFKKFIIVVPSIAIREGVLKNLEITHEHFQNLYNKVVTEHYVYDRTRAVALRSFAISNSIQIMVLNIDAFAKDDNVINKVNETGRKPIEYIQATNPIVIVDEPQNMETEIRKRAVDKLNPLCTLRYSATHVNLYNHVYNLNPVKAYDLGLVKQIEVDSVMSDNQFNEAFVELEGFIKSKTKLKAKLKIDVNTEKGVTRKSISAENDNDLYELSKEREIYKGYRIIQIDAENGYVEFANDVKIEKGQTLGGFKDEIMKIQMEKAIEEHFEKERKYKSKNIKVLTLFFIDRVSNYRNYDEKGNAINGKLGIWFEEIFSKYKNKKENKELVNFPIDKVHKGYFSIDKSGAYKDSSENRETKQDDDTYHLIMRDKERLLDVNEPLRFIFSHSALREGWDNPNVFQICTLNETKSEMKKRQEIGRGLRLCVNSSGERVFERDINKLTVIANESYEEFAKKLQSEIEEECGIEFTNRVKNKRDRVKVSLRKGFEADTRFLELWNRIKFKTTYRVEYETTDLVKSAVRNIKQMPKIEKVKINAIKSKIKLEKDGVNTEMAGSRSFLVDYSDFEIPHILGFIQSRTELTRSTILRILKESGRLGEIFNNPQLFLDRVTSCIKDALNEIIINGIKYEKIAGQEYEMRIFEDEEIEHYINNLYEIKKKDKTITNYIVIDSMSEPEKQFAKDCESNENVEFFFKLPGNFKIKTPVGTYNPDWALIMKNEKRIYFVAETKSTTELNKLHIDEKAKILCGQEHFKQFEGVDYKIVKNVNELI